MRVLAGDIGGTKTLLQISEFDRPSVRGHVVYQQEYASRAYTDVAAMLKGFLHEAALSALDAACLAVAGPVSGNAHGQSAQLTNLPWRLETRALADVLHTPRVRLINDFQAAAYGIEALEPDDLVILQRGEPLPDAPRLVAGAGTGFGAALLIGKNTHVQAMATEAGHAAFAPLDELQSELLRWLSGHYGRVSYERILSGAGLVRIYDFLASRSGKAHGADDTGDARAAEITARAARGEEELAREALDMFIRIYGAYAGDLALITLARGGVYIAGGIAPRIVSQLQSGSFMHAFNGKGRMSDIARAMPVRVVLNPRIGLMGAALAAAGL
ncbi:MAG: glucokinase [Gammaproteobacteria bacterium]|nr:MAG: glucokinase [Gammaproteobacteria bacterium]